MTRARSLHPFAAAISIYGLGLLAITKPLLDMLVASPDFFLVHSMTRIDIIGVVGLLFILPAIAVLPGLVARWLLLKRVASLVDLAVMAVVSALVFAVIVGQSRIGLDGPGAIFVPILGAVILVALVRKSSLAARFLVLVGVVAPFALAPNAMALIPGPAIQPDAAHAIVGKLSTHPNVLLLLFDELPTSSLMAPDGSLMERRFPGFAELARDATWFRNASSAGCYTQLAVPALLTGRAPRPSRAKPTVSEYPANIFTLLSPTHHVEAWEPLTQLCPSGICAPRGHFRPLFFAEHLLISYAYIVAPDLYESKLPDLQSLWIQTASERDKENAVNGDRGMQANDFMSSLQPREKPWLKMAHFALPHSPFEFIRSGQHYFFGIRFLFGQTPNVSGAQQWTGAAEHVHQNYYRHLLQSTYVDSLLAQTIRRLKETNQYDNTVIIVTADHGASFKPGSLHRETDQTNYIQQAAVPLFVKPARTVDWPQRVVDAPINAIDVLPTILDLAGFAPATPASFEGKQWSGRAEAPRAEEEFRQACINPFIANKTVGQGRYKANMLEGIRAEATRAASLFGEEADPRPSFTSQASWLGKAPGDVARLLPSSGRIATIHNRWSNWKAIDLSNHSIPVIIDGILRTSEGTLTQPVSLAIVLNDLIASVMPTIRDGQINLISAMFEQKFLVNGANKIEVYEVTQEDGAATFRSVGVEFD